MKLTRTTFGDIVGGTVFMIGFAVSILGTVIALVHADAIALSLAGFGWMSIGYYTLFNGSRDLKED